MKEESIYNLEEYDGDWDILWPCDSLAHAKEQLISWGKSTKNPLRIVRIDKTVIQGNNRKKHKYIKLHGEYGLSGNVRVYTKEEQARLINKNQDICIHKDGWIISHSAGH